MPPWEHTYCQTISGILLEGRWHIFTWKPFCTLTFCYTFWKALVQQFDLNVFLLIIFSITFTRSKVFSNRSPLHLKAIVSLLRPTKCKPGVVSRRIQSLYWWLPVSRRSPLSHYSQWVLQMMLSSRVYSPAPLTHPPPLFYCGFLLLNHQPPNKILMP